MLIILANTCEAHSHVCVSKELPDTIVYLPLYRITDERLQDSVNSAIAQLEKNYNYNDMYGYVFTMGFITTDIKDSLMIYIGVHDIKSLYSLVTFSHLKIVNIIGCIRQHGYLIIINAGNFVSREEIYNYVIQTGDTIEFDVSACSRHKIFAPVPYNRTEFQVPLKNSNNFVPPIEWNNYIEKMKD